MRKILLTASLALSLTFGVFWFLRGVSSPVAAPRADEAPASSPAASAGGATDDVGVSEGADVSDGAAPPFAPEPDDAPPKPTPIAPVTLVFGGDVLLDRGVARRLEQTGDETSVFDAALARRFLEADIAVVNLEMPFSLRGAPMKDKQYTFRGDPERVQYLKETMGVDLVTLANNHVLDYGVDAMMDTLKILDENGIYHVGAGANEESAAAPVVFRRGGRTIAFLGASRVIPTPGWKAGKDAPGLFTTYDGAALCAAIQKAKEDADFVIVYVHWGIEGESRPRPYQVGLAHDYIDAGADLVVGSHPHVLQSLEYYKEKLIVYSLGNWIFTDAAKDTMALAVTLAPDDAPPEAQAIFARIHALRTEPVVDETALAARAKALAALSPGVYVDAQGRIGMEG